MHLLVEFSNENSKSDEKLSTKEKFFHFRQKKRERTIVKNGFPRIKATRTSF